MESNPNPGPSGCCVLSPRTILELRGPDAVRFLNGQITNDVQGIAVNETIYTAVLNAKGHLDAVCHVHAHADGFLIDADPSLQETLLSRLDRYLIADDVSLSDVSHNWHLLHLLHLNLEDSPLTPPADSLISTVNRFGVPGTDILSPSPIQVPPESLISSQQINNFRISHGIPLWPIELTTGTLPPEAGLDSTAISYDKGCYLGQEVISRMKRAGKTNCHLVQLEVPAGTTPSSLLHNGEEAGTVTSVATPSNSETTTALGFRKRKYEEINSFTLPDGSLQVSVTKRLA